jgi:hypothetical protein
MDIIIKTNKTLLAIFLLSVCISFVSLNASALTFVNSKTASNSSGQSTKSKEIIIYDVEFTPELSKELLERIVAKTDYDFSHHNVANRVSKKCKFHVRRVEYDIVEEGKINSWAILTGSLSIKSGVVTISNGYWKQGGLSSDRGYLDEFNVRLTSDGHFVGKMAFFLLGVDTGEVPVSPLYPKLTLHKNNKPFDDNMRAAEFWIDVNDWAGGVMSVYSCKDL